VDRAVAGIPLPPPGELLAFRLLRDAPAFEKALEEAVTALAADYGSLFRAGYFEPAFVVDHAPREGFTPEALPLAVVCSAYALAFEDVWEDESTDAAIREAARWASAVCRSARAKECLVNLLSRDVEIVPGHFEPMGLPKLMLMTGLTGRDLDDYGWGNDQKSSDGDEALRRVLGELSVEDWLPVLDHSRHDREGVRAGAFLLLCHHPSRETFVARANEALQDSSRLVRLAAAAALAYHRDPSGEEVLVEGLKHERWEVRYWCARSLAYFADAGHLPLIQALSEVEPDPWVKDQLGDMERAWDP
jgi:hypothetical protein